MVDRVLPPLVARARKPVDASSVAVFRMIFGSICLWEVTRYFRNGWVEKYWEEPDFHFHYVGFGWVEPLPAPGMQILWAVLGVAGFAIAIGAFYRVATVVFAVGFGYSFLIETGMYLNHFYFLALLAILMTFVPAHRVWSVDSWLRHWPQDQPIPAWGLHLLQFQVAVLYIGGGIAKLEPDWLRGQPMGMWLAGRTDFPLIGGLFDHPYAGVIAAWSGLYFDLFIVFAVAWRRMRALGLMAALAFHFTNAQLFSIGVFPFVALACLLLFCEPDWPRVLLSGLRRQRWKPPVFAEPPPLAGHARALANVGLAAALIYGAFQVVVPLRHLAMPGRSAWTEAGHTFAWHMKQRDKDGIIMFSLVRPGEPKAYVNPASRLPSFQYSAMKSRPELIRQYAHHLADQAMTDQPDKPRPQVHAIALVSLNGREPRPMVDKRVDLAAEAATLGTPSWVVPLREPLPAPDQVWDP